MVNPSKLFKTIGINENTALIQYEYTEEDIINDRKGEPFLFSGITATEDLTKKDLNDEKAFLEKVQGLLKIMIDRLQKEIDEIERFKGWYDK